MKHPDLRIDHSVADGRVALSMDGVLDSGTYRIVRDAIVKCALEVPAAIVVDVSALRVPSESAWSVFTSARWLTAQWPAVPIALVCRHASGRRSITRNGIVRYLPLYSDVDVAVHAVGASGPPPRRRVRALWPAKPSALPLARGFVSEWLAAWSHDDIIATACVVTTALVDNVLVHTASDPDLRLESDGVNVTIAVTDGSPELATIHEDDEARSALSELNVVSAVTRVWGNTPLPEGKVVWAVMGPENKL